MKNQEITRQQVLRFQNPETFAILYSTQFEKGHHIPDHNNPGKTVFLSPITLNGMHRRYILKFTRSYIQTARRHWDLLTQRERRAIEELDQNLDACRRKGTGYPELPCDLFDLFQ